MIRLAPDTNLLVYRASRELLHGISLASGIALVVLPQVMLETRRRIRTVEEGYISKALQSDTRWDDAHKARIMLAAGQGADDWFVDEVQRDGNAYTTVDQSLDQTWATRRMATSLPPGVVRHNPPEAEGDPLIIAEALVHNVTLLSTNNLRTINHELANEWARTVSRSNSKLVHTPDETLAVLSEGDWKHVMRWTIAYGGTRLVERTEDRWREAFEATIGMVRGAGFGDTAERMAWFHETEPAFEGFVRTALDETRSSADQATASEQRKQAKVQAAMSKQGWSP